MVDVCSPGGVEGGVCCCASRLLPPADPLAPSSPPLNLLQLQKNMALMLSRRVIKSSKNQIFSMTRAYSVNDDLPNNPVNGLPHLIMYCPRNPITFDPNSTNPNDYVLAKVPKLVQTLEWLLPSPCPVHQFDEPPIIVEIEHLKNLHYDE